MSGCANGECPNFKGTASDICADCRSDLDNVGRSADGLLTEGQKRIATKAVRTYVQTLRSSGHDLLPTEADVDHSALLQRLLDGHPPLPIPPPKSYSSPDYALGEGREISVIDPPAFNPAGGAYPVCINQSTAYRWVSPDGILQHQNGDHFKWTPSPQTGRWPGANPTRVAGTLKKVDPPKRGA